MSNDAPAAPGEDDTPVAVAESHGASQWRDLGAEEKGRGRPTPNPPQSAPAATPMRAHQKPGRAACSILGCEQPMYARQVCTMHYTRLRKSGTVGEPSRYRAEPGAGSINGYGYIVHTNRHDHPLATAQGKLLEHRVVLFDAIGPGTHPCHWCGVILSWQGRPSQRICTDHLDHNKLNNTRENLVVSCLDCNTKRRAVPYVPKPKRKYVYVLTERQKQAARERARAYYYAKKAAAS
jgi:hypothetical protein